MHSMVVKTHHGLWIRYTPLGSLETTGHSPHAQHDGSHNVTDDGWFCTGDMACIDQHGHVQLTDRTKDVIKSGGEWISSIELENVATGHSQVRALLPPSYSGDVAHLDAYS